MSELLTSFAILPGLPACLAGSSRCVVLGFTQERLSVADSSRLSSRRNAAASAQSLALLSNCRRRKNCSRSKHLGLYRFVVRPVSGLALQVTSPDLLVLSCLSFRGGGEPRSGQSGRCERFCQVSKAQGWNVCRNLLFRLHPTDSSRMQRIS